MSLVKLIEWLNDYKQKQNKLQNRQNPTSKSLITLSKRKDGSDYAILNDKDQTDKSINRSKPMNTKQARNTTQIYLGNRQATILTNFDHFPNLQIAWLNQNNLTSLQGLQKNFRIKHLFLQNNKLKKLQNVFYTLKHVETLVLYDNQLRDLDKVLQSLKPLSSLKHLDLYDNPVAQQPNYKLRVLYALPTLEILDRHKVSHQERDEAVKFMAGHKGKVKGEKKPFSW